MMTAFDIVEHVDALDTDRWVDTILIAGLVVALGILVFLLAG